MSRVPVWLIIPAALTLSACGSQSAGSGDVPGGTLDGDWTLVEGTSSGEPVDSFGEWTVTLTIDGGDATGTSACNSYFGTIEIDGASVRFEGLGGTEMACEPGAMALEQAYLGALADVREAAVEDDQLVLSADSVELRFEQVEPVAPAALVGTSWVLEATIGVGGPGGSASSPVGEPATLELTDDGGFSGSTGCNMFTATYVVDGDELELTNLEQTLRSCDGDVGAQERAMIAVLTQSLRFSIDASMLTITSPDGSGLVYRVRDDETIQEPLPPPQPTAATGSWLLREGTSDGQPIRIDDHRIRLTVAPDQLNATVGCNDLTVEVRIDDTTIAGGEFVTTDMLCPDLDDLENAYQVALTLPLTYERTGDQLVLRGDRGELTFERAAETDPAALVGRTWVLDSMLEPDGTRTPAVGGGQVIFADNGTFAGVVGECSYDGQYAIEGAHVSVGPVHQGGCPVESVTARVFAAQSDGFVPILDGDTMTIMGPDGAGVVYVVEHPTN